MSTTENKPVKPEEKKPEQISDKPAPAPEKPKTNAVSSRTKLLLEKLNAAVAD